MSKKDHPSQQRWLVDVAVPVPLRQTFTYALPKNLDPQSVKKGYRTLVPFGPRLLHGVSLSDAYLSKTPHVRLRTLTKFDASQRVLSEEITQLVEWMAQYYRSPIGEIVKLALPPGVLGNPKVSYQITEAGRTHLLDHPEDRILGLLDPFPSSKKAWEVKAQAEIMQKQIRAWEDAGLIEILTETPAKEAIPHALFYALAPGKIKKGSEALARAPKQAAMVAWFQNQKKSHVSKPEIFKAFPASGSILRALVEKGWLIESSLPTHSHDLAPQNPEQLSQFQLTSEQDKAFQAIRGALDQKCFEPFLMFGVTGSGKTEVYLRAISHCLKQGRQALFLVPEIALTPLMQRRIEARFGERLAILHSAVGKTQRSEAWSKVLAGKVEVVLGARSGIFAPLPRLGLIIVDEEHDTSYKQHEGIRYHARDLALVRAKMARAAIILGSATPSLESWHNQERGRSTLLTLTKRATQALLPAVSIVDMRQEFKEQRKRVLFSKRLVAQLRASLQADQQAMILLNRRGYHSFLLCRKCGETMHCSQCDVSLTYHRTDGRLKCHYCDETRPIPIECPHCGSAAAAMQFFGEGTQQIQEALEKEFPGVAIDRLDRDQLTRKDAHRRILKKFAEGDTQILVGTQMIAKGHDFPNVTTVGIINADQGLRMPDFRSAEHVFQLITQVAGRSGRGSSPGTVVIQTYMPEHYSIQCAANHDFPAFLQKEMRYRQHLFYPPYSHTVHILVQESQSDKAWQAIQWMVHWLRNHPESAQLTILGPTKALVGKIKNLYRFQLLLKSGNRSLLHRISDQVVETALASNILNRTAVFLDIDPYQFG